MKIISKLSSLIKIEKLDRILEALKYGNKQFERKQIKFDLNKNDPSLYLVNSCY